LSRHLEATGERAALFGALFGASEACGLVGLLHDIGKADPAWQEYLVAAAAGLKPPRVDHKHAGAFLLQDWGLGSLAYIVAGHHGGLPDAVDLRSILQGGRTPGQTAAIGAAVGQLGVQPPDEDPRRHKVPTAHSAAGSSRHGAAAGVVAAVCVLGSH
jgi:CRISPR-associated endonuclease/helicase Cas3